MAGGGKLKRSLAELRKGPKLHDQAMAAIEEGDTKTALEMLEELQELLQLDDDDFSKMLGAQFDRDPQMKFDPNAIDDYDVNMPVGGDKRAPDSPMRPKEKLAEGGPPKGKGALIQAAEIFARRQGKKLNEGLDIPEGFDHFYTKHNPDTGATAIIGVASDGYEQNVGTIASLHKGDDTRKLADQLASAYNTGGFSDMALNPVPLEEVFGIGKAPEGPPKADVLPIEGIDVTEHTLPGGIHPEGDRYRSFKEHLENLMKVGDPDEYELADLATIAEDSLEPLEYESLMEDLYDAGLTPKFYREFAENVPKEPFFEADVTLQGGPIKLGEILEGLGISPDELGDTGVRQRLMELMGEAEGLADFDPAGKTVRNVETGEVSRTVDLRRMTHEELSTLQNRGEIDTDLAEELMENMVDLESEFQDIIYDITGDWPDELRIMPDLQNPEHYVIESHSLDTDARRYHAFDPETGPRDATRQEIDSFSTERPEALGYETPRGVTGNAEPNEANAILKFWEEYHGGSGDLEIYADPNRAGIFGFRDKSYHGDLRDHGGGLEGGIIDLNSDNPFDTIEGVEFTDWPPKPRFQEGGHVREDGMTAKEFLRAVGQSLGGALPFIGEEAALVGRDVGEQIYRKGALPVAGLKSQWWGVNPTTDEFEYAGPFSDTIHGRGRPAYPDEGMLHIAPEMYQEQFEAWRDWEDPGETGAIPGIIDETALLPAMPQMIEMMTDRDEMQTDPDYEPFIGAPDFALHAADRADENWTRALESVGFEPGEGPEGFTENALMAGGMMIGQIPLPTSWLSRLKVIPRAFMSKGMRAAHVLGDLMEEAAPSGPARKALSAFAGAGPEFLFPTIDPSLMNYMMGSGAGGALLTWAGNVAEEIEIESMMQPTLSNIGDAQRQSIIDLKTIAGDPSHPEQKVARKAFEQLQAMYKQQMRELQARKAKEEWETMSDEDRQERYKKYYESEDVKRALEELRHGSGRMMAKGGKIRGLTRRDFLKGAAGAGATALAAGKAGVRTGADEVADLTSIAKELEVPVAAAGRAAAPSAMPGAPWRKVITQVLDIERKEWPGDLEMKEMYDQDTADYKYIAKAMEEGRIEDAVTMYDGMDTAARELIYDVDPDTTIALRRQLGKAGSDYDALEWDDLDVGEQEIILDELEGAYQDGGMEAYNTTHNRIIDDYGVDLDDIDLSDFFEFMD